MFTMFEDCTINLLYLVNYFFEDVNIFKPVTSKLGNSEVYTICLRYRGGELLEPYIKHLQSAFGTDLYKQFTLFPSNSINPLFLFNIRYIAQFFSRLQCQVINDNLKTFKNYSSYYKIKREKDDISRYFIEYYQLKPIANEHTLLKNQISENHQVLYFKKSNRGSFNDRLCYQVEGPKRKLMDLEMVLEKDIMTLKSIFLTENRTLKLYSNNSLKLELRYGTPIDKICSSKFIFSPILSLFLNIMSVEAFRTEIRKCDKYETQNVGMDNHNRVVFPDYNFEHCFDEFQKKCFNMIVDKLTKLKMHENLYLVNMNLLTSFNVGLIKLMSTKYFRDVTFYKDEDVVVCHSFLKPRLLIQLNEIMSKLMKCNKTKAILGFFSVINTMRGEGENDLYDTIVAYNNTVYKRKCLNYLNMLNKSIL